MRRPREPLLSVAFSGAFVLLLAGCGGGGGGGKAKPVTAPKAAPFLSIENAALREGDQGRTEVTFQVLLSEPTDREVTVEYTTLERSALSGKDYLGATGTLVLPAGATAGTIQVKVLGDDMDEDDEVFSMILRDPRNGVLDRQEALGTIEDDDPRPSLSAIDKESREGGEREVHVAVRLAPESGRLVTVEYETKDGTAKAGEDYVATSGVLTFLPGATEERLSIRILDDSRKEPEETFSVILRNPANASILAGEAKVKVKNDDTGRHPTGGKDHDQDEDKNED